MFSEKELAFLKTQPLTRLATVASDGQPTVDAVGYEFDGSHIYIGGHNFQNSRKYKNIAGGNQKVSLIFDDLESINPWKPRGIRIFGTARPIEREGRFGPAIYVEITPTVSWSWGIEDVVFAGGKPSRHKVIWK